MSELCKCPQLMAGTTTVRSGWSAECPVHKSTDPIASFTAHAYVAAPDPRDARIAALEAEVERLRHVGINEAATDAIHTLNMNLSAFLVALERDGTVTMDRDDIAWLKRWFDAGPSLPIYNA